MLVFYKQWKIMSDLNISYGKMSDFVSFPLFGFILVIKLRNFGFESQWSTLICFDKKRYGVRLNMSHDFVSFPFFGFTLAIFMFHTFETK